MRPVAGLLIGDVSKRTGVPAPTIRYYEAIGLLASPARSGAGYRRYSDVAVEELRFVRKAQALGFSLGEIAEILGLSRAGKAPCSHVLSLAHQHLAAVDERIRQLSAFRRQLAGDLTRWEEQRSVVTCTGLCRFITDAEPAAAPLGLKSGGAAQQARGGLKADGRAVERRSGCGGRRSQAECE